MKADNVRYLVFNADGKLVGMDNRDGDVLIVMDERLPGGKLGIQFGFSVSLDCNGVQMTLGEGGKLSLPYAFAMTKSKCLGCQDYSFHTVEVFGKFYSAIVYHECFETIGYHFFYEWYKFFLPEKEPLCCCQGRFLNRQLPHANAVMKSMCDYFSAKSNSFSEAYSNNYLGRDLRIHDRRYEPEPAEAGSTTGQEGTDNTLQ